MADAAPIVDADGALIDSAAAMPAAAGRLLAADGLRLQTPARPPAAADATGGGPVPTFATRGPR